ncbi:TIR-like protein FxsC [Kitasatospora sp. NPDC057223]|uniref:TIR-like protein FxsC n=1 Tax=Kitasatospora sp. NPDC057223 TaxID=3346055 RepID=UPI0036436EF9
MVEVFLSFCEEDNRNGLVEQFYADLSEEILRRTTLDRVKLGYQYLRMRTGSVWRSELAQALSTCKVFIALYSPRYFNSSFCGKEWYIFSSRLRESETGPSEALNAIIPVLWESVFDSHEAVPKAAADIWAKDPEFGTEYIERGLRQITQLNFNPNYRTSYEEIVMALAKRVIESIRASRLSDSEPIEDFDSIPDAFAAPELSAATQDSLGGSPERASVPSARPGHVRFAVAASTAEEIKPLRQNLSQYGPRVDDWAPYMPDAPGPIVGYAVDVAREFSLVPHPENFDDDVAGLLDGAERNNELAIIILDPWTVRLEKRKEALRAYDGRLCIHAGLVVPQSSNDEETVARSVELQHDINETLTRHARVRQGVFKSQLDSISSFKAGVREVLVELTRILMVESENVRPAIGAKFIPRPTIDGPGDE